MRPSRSAGLLIRQFSVTRERIREALRKLEHPSGSRRLRSFLDTRAGKRPLAPAFSPLGAGREGPASAGG